jgi:hypothetical protein
MSIAKPKGGGRIQSTVVVLMLAVLQLVLHLLLLERRACQQQDFLSRIAAAHQKPDITYMLAAARSEWICSISVAVSSSTRARKT